MKLTARFTIKLSKPFFLLGPVEEIRFHITLDDFTDEITLIPIEKGHEYKNSESKWPIYCVNRIVLSISAEEDILPAKFKDGGTRNDDEIVQYLDKRIEKYASHATLIVKRLIRFFKYELRNPLLNPDELDISGLYNPVWTDESGEQIEPSRRCIVMERIQGFDPDSKYGSHPLIHEHINKLGKYIEDDGREVELYEELLSDAQAAILQKNHRRALLELAIACEVAIKQKFFIKKTPAGDVFEYLEDSKRLQVTVMDLIHGAAEQAFGTSFKKQYPADYQNIDFLFRCRNKIAHRGEIQYKDDKGVIHAIQDSTIKIWWDSAALLLKWLKEI